MLVDELQREIEHLHPHPLTKVILGGTWAEPGRLELHGGELVIGSDLDESDVPDDWWCELGHLSVATIGECVARIAEIHDDEVDHGVVDEHELAQLNATPAGELDRDELLYLVAHRHRLAVAEVRRREAFHLFLEAVTGRRLAYRSGEWVSAAPRGADIVDTRPL